MIDYTATYGNLRSQLLSRHALVNKRFRTNRFNDVNHIQSTPEQVYATTDVAERAAKLWEIDKYDDGNPLMATGKLLTCLAVEHHLGSTTAAPIIRGLLGGLEALFKFVGNDFDGYVMRGDPVDFDGWDQDDGGDFNANFYVEADGTYSYCVPQHDPRSIRRPSRTTWEGLAPGEREEWWEAWHNWAFRYRAAQEPSQDELVGLIMGYDMVSRLVDVPEVQDTVGSQTERIATYLSAHSYYLVRPAGGFSIAGASGALPGMEHPFTRVFTRTTGSPHPSIADFPQAMRKAGVWEALAGPYAEGTVAGPLIGAPLVATLLGPLLGPSAGVLVAPFLPSLLVPAGQAAAIYDNREVFDVLWDASTPNGDGSDWAEYGDASATEFAAAHILAALPPSSRFEILLTALLNSESWAGGFVPYMGLTGLDDDDPTVRVAYLEWLARRDKPPVVPPGVVTDRGDPWLFAGAVGCLLGGAPGALVHVGTPEEYLANAVQAQVVAQGYYRGGMPLAAADEGGSWERSLAALDTMTGIALAWLHAQRRTASGQPIAEPLFPRPPSSAELDTMPTPRLPEATYRSTAWSPPPTVLQATDPVVVDSATADQPSGVDLSRDAPLPARSAVPPALAPQRGPLVLLVDQQVEVREDGDGVEVAAVLRRGDEFEVAATGTVWSGIVGEPAHGPGGRGDTTNDRDFPLWGTADAHPFALVGRLGPYGEYFYVGDGLDRRTYLGDDSGPLVLRVNDDSPGNGSGAFQCTVRVWGVPARRKPVVSTDPPAIVVDVPVTTTVHATHPVTGVAVAGDVLVDGAVVGRTGEPFTRTFTITLTRVVDPTTHEVEFVEHEPTGSVRPDDQDTLLDADVPFTFRQQRLQLAVSVVPRQVAVNRATQVTVNATDTLGHTVRLPVAADGAWVGMTGEPFSHTFVTIPSQGRIRGHSQAEGTVSFTYPVVVPQAVVHCEPDQIETGKRTVTLKVTAMDSVSNAWITTGTVVIAGRTVGQLGVPFSYTFEVYAELDTSTRPPTWELPEGSDVVVHGMPGYADRAAHLTFFGHHTKPQRVVD